MQLFILSLLLILSTVASGDELSCQVGLSKALPSVGLSTDEIAERVLNRGFSPCDHQVKPAKSKKELCLKQPRDFQSLLCSKEGRMSFENKKGLFGLNTGLCWWHSQFHRNATYLSYFNPKKKKLNPNKRKDKRKLKKLIREIIKKKGLVEIPGYSSLREFTADKGNEEIIQKELQRWMAKDSFLRMKWINGLTAPNNYTVKSKDYYMNNGRWTMDPSREFDSPQEREREFRKLERNTYKTKAEEDKAKKESMKHQSKQINKLLSSVNNKNQIAYITLQYKGLSVAHSQIVLDSNIIVEDGKRIFEFRVQDSNFQNDNWVDKFSPNATSTIRYDDGIWYMKAFSDSDNEPSYEPINIQVNNTKDLDKVDKVFKKECGSNLFN